MERLTKVFSIGNEIEVIIEKVGNLTCEEVCGIRTEGNGCDDCPIDNALRKLAHYEDLEEQGRLILLPCKVGDTVYFIDRTYNRTIREFIDFVNIGYVKAIKFSARPTKVTIEYDDGRGQGRCKGADYHASNIGKTLFLTKEEAEAKLKEGAE